VSLCGFFFRLGWMGLYLGGWVALPAFWLMSGLWLVVSAALCGGSNAGLKRVRGGLHGWLCGIWLACKAWLGRTALCTLAWAWPFLWASYFFSPFSPTSIMLVHLAE
jgi:hypothetical protein